MTLPISPPAHPPIVAATIAGSDPSGGAGIQADLKTFQQLGVFGTSVITLLTVQNTRAVERVFLLDPALVQEQYESVIGDLSPAAIKTGALGSQSMVEALAECLGKYRGKVVIDPVLVSKHGHRLADEATAAAVLQHLLPHSWFITPNRFEAEQLTGIQTAAKSRAAAAQEVAIAMLDALQAAGASNVLLKWGEKEGQSIHWLRTSDGQTEMLVKPRMAAGFNHGSGCVLSAALTAYAALGLLEPAACAREAIDRTWEALDSNSNIGQGIHPVDVRRMKTKQSIAPTAAPS